MCRLLTCSARNNSTSVLTAEMKIYFTFPVNLTIWLHMTFDLVWPHEHMKHSMLHLWPKLRSIKACARMTNADPVVADNENREKVILFEVFCFEASNTKTWAQLISRLFYIPACKVKVLGDDLEPCWLHDMIPDWHFILPQTQILCVF